MPAAQPELVDGIQAELAEAQLAQGFEAQVQAVQDAVHTWGIVPLKAGRGRACRSHPGGG